MRCKALILLSGLLLVGCSTSPDREPFTADDPNLRVQPTLAAAFTGVAGTMEAGLEAVGLFLRTPPKQFAQTLVDETATADARRNAINGLVRRPAGQSDTYVAAYAAIAADTSGEDALVRAVAVRALNRSEADRSELYISLLTDRDERVRLEAAKALSKVPADDAVAPLLAMATDSTEDLDVRLAAVYALRHYAQPEVVERLVALLDAQPFAVAFQARTALVRMLGIDRGYDRDAWLSPQSTPTGAG